MLFGLDCCHGVVWLTAELPAAYVDAQFSCPPWEGTAPITSLARVINLFFVVVCMIGGARLVRVNGTTFGGSLDDFLWEKYGRRWERESDSDEDKWRPLLWLLQEENLSLVLAVPSRKEFDAIFGPTCTPAMVVAHRRLWYFSEDDLRYGYQLQGDALRLSRPSSCTVGRLREFINDEDNTASRINRQSLIYSLEEALLTPQLYARVGGVHPAVAGVLGVDISPLHDPNPPANRGGRSPAGPFLIHTNTSASSAEGEIRFTFTISGATRPQQNVTTPQLAGRLDPIYNDNTVEKVRPQPVDEDNLPIK